MLPPCNAEPAGVWSVCVWCACVCACVRRAVCDNDAGHPTPDAGPCPSHHRRRQTNLAITAAVPGNHSLATGLNRGLVVVKRDYVLLRE